MRARRLLLVLVAAVLATGLAAVAPGVREVRAATPDLAIVSQARYDVQPGKRRIRVTVELTLTNRLADTKTKRYYFDEAFLAILPGATGFKLSWEGEGVPAVQATKRTRDVTMLRLGLARRIYGGKSAAYRLTFNLNDPGGKPARDLRVGDSLVSFPVWAFATDDTPGSSVTVVFPKGFDVTVAAGRIAKPTTTEAGRTVFRTGRLGSPLTFFAYLTADRPGAYRETTVETTVSEAPVEVLVRSWPDDRRWAKRVGGLLKRALPVLGERIGLPWPHPGPLTVQEAVSRSTGGYAGLYDPTEARVEIAYYAGDFVVLHEAAHTWFNGALLADRWANEAFASYYAEVAADEIEVRSHPTELTDALEAARIPLNAWGPVGSETEVVEEAAYAASLALARAIGERSGPERLARVWADAAARTGAYQPPSGPGEQISGPPDWRVLLDLLEERTDLSFDDLWRTWVARETDLPLLDARAVARGRYDDVVADSGGWRLPASIRASMRAWRFEDATALLDDAALALERRTAVETAIRDAGLIAPAALRLAFEDDDGFDDVMAEADAELEAVERYNDAVALRPAPEAASPFVALGLWNEDPEASISEARAALAAGDLATSVAHASEASAMWASAVPIGQGRAFSLAMLVAAALLAVMLALFGRKRRHQRRVKMMATPFRH